MLNRVSVLVVGLSTEEKAKYFASQQFDEGAWQESFGRVDVHVVLVRISYHFEQSTQQRPILRWYISYILEACTTQEICVMM